MKTYLVTGAAGFIGANYLKYILNKHEDIFVVVLDKLTYAGNLKNIENELKDKRVEFVKGDICNNELVENISYDIDYVVNFAAESHVDRSIENPKLFLETNILGTQTLLEIQQKNSGQLAEMKKDIQYIKKIKNICKYQQMKFMEVLKKI